MTVNDFPSQDEWQRIYSTTPFEQLSQKVVAFANQDSSERGLSGFEQSVDTKEFLLQLQYRLTDTAKSYTLLTYFFEKGIPDNEWYISPGRSGASIEYFPHFEPIHFLIKDWFDYYADTFYHKLFSAWDMLGHILNVQYRLSIKQQSVSFHQAVKKLSDKDKALHAKLDEIRNHSAFREAKRLRNDITHNHLPSSTGISVTLNEKGGGIGIREYTTSAAITKNAQEVVALLEKAVLLITA